MILIWRIAAKSLNGVAHTLQGATGAIEKISIQLENHSESDAKVFQAILTNLEKQNVLLIRIEDRTRGESSPPNSGREPTTSLLTSQLPYPACP